MPCLHLRTYACHICDRRYCKDCQQSYLYSNICIECEKNKKFSETLSLQKLLSEIRKRGTIHIFSPYEEFEIYYSGILNHKLSDLSDVHLYQELKHYLTQKFKQ